MQYHGVDHVCQRMTHRRGMHNISQQAVDLLVTGFKTVWKFGFVLDMLILNDNFNYVFKNSQALATAGHHGHDRATQRFT